MMTPASLLVVTCLSAFALLISPSLGCNEAICASLVSKCMLIKSCECDMTDKKNCTCCKDCHVCLSKRYTECCSCVGLCPLPKIESSKKSSSVEDLTDPIPDLFHVLTDEADRLLRWTSESYPIEHDTFYSFQENKEPTGDMEFSISIDHNNVPKRHRHGHGEPQQHSHANCTVAFMSQCMSMRKCKDACKSMGASRYRWFHEHGCCQCIGHTCLSYGLKEAKCLKCPLDEEEEEEEELRGGFENMFDTVSQGADVLK